jgi:hypothetical protein
MWNALLAGLSLRRVSGGMFHVKHSVVEDVMGGVRLALSCEVALNCPGGYTYGKHVFYYMQQVLR